jgi:hypothetical protein
MSKKRNLDDFLTPEEIGAMNPVQCANVLRSVTVAIDTEVEASASEERVVTPLKAVRNFNILPRFSGTCMARVDGEDSPPNTSSPPRAIGHPWPPRHLDADATAVSRQAQETTSTRRSRA